MNCQELTGAFVLYLPVYHNGHRQLFQRYPRVRRVYIVPGAELASYSPVHKDLHALPERVIKKTLQALDCFERVGIATPAQWPVMRAEEHLITGYEEDVWAWLVDHDFDMTKVIQSDIFLRWTKKKILEKTRPPHDVVVAGDDPAIQEIEKILAEKSLYSSDFWRQVAVVLRLANGEVIISRNQHLPDDQTPYMVGDMRGQFHRGEHIELTGAIHAEAAAIAAAARAGTSTVGAELFVTDFPCPVCAKLIVAAGIQAVYYWRRYALADAAAIFQAAGVKLVWVMGENGEEIDAAL